MESRAIPTEMLRKVKRIEIRTRRLVNESLAGEYHSVFKGRGMEFAEVREYQPGDDVRSIDWNVTSRMGHPYVKKYVEERELTVLLLFDASSSGQFGTFRQTKREMAVEVAALLAFSAIKNNDRVGLIIFTDRIEKFIPPKKSREHGLRVIREVLYFRPRGAGTDIKRALEFLNRVISKRCVVFLLSDFYSSDYERILRVANKKHDVICLSVSDPRELDLPDTGLLQLEDAETGKEILIDTSDEVVRSIFSRLSRKDRKNRDDMFKSVGIDAVNIRTDEPYEKPLVHFFQMRARKLRWGK
jgi:uncharacterized protein (DUF58 family)